MYLVTCSFIDVFRSFCDLYFIILEQVFFCLFRLFISLALLGFASGSQARTLIKECQETHNLYLDLGIWGIVVLPI
jgi:hypothetical protein